jgi:Putative zinc-finger
VHDQGKFGDAGRHEGFSCLDFDLLLSDAIDGKLAGSELTAFQHHVGECSTCGPAFADTQAGLNWLRVLEPVDVPGNLVHNILVATSLPDKEARAQIEQRAGWRERATQVLESVLVPVFNIVRQPRFALNTAMAFFSVSLLLNVAGFKLSGVHLADLTPSAIKTNATLKYYETTSRVVKYYENIRFVYELESTVRELKRATTNNQPEQNSAPKKKNDNTTQQPERRNENYSRRDDDTILAAGHNSQLLLFRAISPRAQTTKSTEGVFLTMSDEFSMRTPGRLA